MAGECRTSCPCHTGSKFSCELHSKHCSSGARLQQGKREKTQCGPGFEYLIECGKGLGLLASSGVRCTVQVLESLFLQSGRFSESWRLGRICHGVPGLGSVSDM